MVADNSQAAGGQDHDPDVEWTQAEVESTAADEEAEVVRPALDDATAGDVHAILNGVEILQGGSSTGGTEGGATRVPSDDQPSEPNNLRAPSNTRGADTSALGCASHRGPHSA